jgi:hypothetical protein
MLDDPCLDNDWFTQKQSLAINMLPLGSFLSEIASNFSLLKIVNYFLGFLFRRMGDGPDRTYILTPPAKHYTCVQVLNNCFLCTIFLFKPKRLHVTKVNAFSAGNAFLIIDFWSPRYLVSGYSLVCFFRHWFSTLIFNEKGAGAGI